MSPKISKKNFRRALKNFKTPRPLPGKGIGSLQVPLRYNSSDEIAPAIGNDAILKKNRVKLFPA
jgi:hypothetical protein